MKKNYPISATFIDEITYDIPASNWTEKQWKKELDYMKDVGIDTVVFIRGVFYDKAIYPSKHFYNLKEENEDFGAFILQETAKRNMKVYLGLYISNLSWNDGDWKGEIEQNKIYIEEVLARYKDYPSFVGWYIPHETGYEAPTTNIKATMGGLAELCKTITPEKKVLVSPFFISKMMREKFVLTPEQTREEWEKIWEDSGKYIDVCAFQDGTCELCELQDYFKAARQACDKFGIELWSNVETFERDVRCMYYPIPFDLLRRKIDLARPIVDKMMTFEFSHFLSPQSIYPSARNLNRLYKRWYGKKK